MGFINKILLYFRERLRSIYDWFLGDIPIYPYLAEDDLYNDRVASADYRSVDEPIESKHDKGENKVSGIKMICIVCEECHEKDRLVTGCTKDLNSHAQSTTHERCNVCGKKSDKLIFCRKYIKFKKNPFLDIEEK